MASFSSYSFVLRFEHSLTHFVWLCCFCECLDGD